MRDRKLSRVARELFAATVWGEEEVEEECRLRGWNTSCARGGIFASRFFRLLPRELNAPVFLSATAGVQSRTGANANIFIKKQIKRDARAVFFSA